VEDATTDPVDVTGAMARASFMTQAYVPDPLIQVVHPTPIRVTVIMEGSGDEKKVEQSVVAARVVTGSATFRRGKAPPPHDHD